jgi:hypothetical protein
MIQHIRTMPFPLPPVEDLPAVTVASEDTDLADTSLDHLLKHALKTMPQDVDGGRIWDNLARRVRGPFGAAALEAPAFNSSETELMTSGGRVRLAPFVLSDKVQKRSREHAHAIDCLFEMLRVDSSGRWQPSCVWMFS